jgi:hypothetical protein
VADYERLRGGQLTAITAESIADLAPALIKARIMRNWTQKEPADKLASAEQQVQRYEATQYKRKFLTDMPDSLVNTLTGFALEICPVAGPLKRESRAMATQIRRPCWENLGITSSGRSKAVCEIDAVSR